MGGVFYWLYDGGENLHRFDKLVTTSLDQAAIGGEALTGSKHPTGSFESIPELTIAIILHAKSQQITVEDTGPGIDPEILPKIFDVCFTQQKQGGTGIGLPFFREAIKSMSGAISCESEKGKYTAFTLTFPEVPKSKLELKSVA